MDSSRRKLVSVLGPCAGAAVCAEVSGSPPTLPKRNEKDWEEEEPGGHLPRRPAPSRREASGVRQCRPTEAGYPCSGTPSPLHRPGSFRGVPWPLCTDLLGYPIGGPHHLCTDLGPSGGYLGLSAQTSGVPHRGTPSLLHRPPGAGGYLWLGPHHLRTDPGPPHASTLASLHRPRGPNKRKPQAGAGPAVCTSQRSRKIPRRQP